MMPDRCMNNVDADLAENIRQAEEEATAAALGKTVDELATAREAGKRVPELAKENGMDMAEIQAAVEAAREGVLADAVTDGTLTQAEADSIQECLAQGPGHGPSGNPPEGAGGPPMVMRGTVLWAQVTSDR